MATASSTVKGSVSAFHTEPDLHPPAVTVKQPPGRGAAPGYVFLTPRAAKQTQPTGPMILDRSGRLVWFRPEAGRSFVNLTSQRYRGKVVLTWSERPPFLSPEDIYEGDPEKIFNVIADEGYRVMYRVRAVGDGVGTDLHDMVMTKQNTALILGYRQVPMDLTRYGGSRNGIVIEGLLQEIDPATNRVIHNWSSLDHIPLSESGVDPIPGRPWDYFHINSIDVDTDGNLLMSARHTSTIYKLDRRTGRIIWRLGGDQSDFVLGEGVRFHFQHDAQRLPNGTISLFDNGATEFDRKGEQSRVLELHVNEKTRVASLEREVGHDGPVLSVSQGNADTLPNGDLFVGWGNAPYFSEYSKDGRQIFDASLPSPKNQTYRAFKGQWLGRPRSSPKVEAARSGDHTLVFVSWNGATGVARWRVRGGPETGLLKTLGTAPWRGFETRLDVAGKPRVIELQALDRSGKVIGTSEAVRPSGG